MPEHFERLGLVYGPTGAAWHRSHCQNPFVQQLSATRYRVHFAARDDKNRSQGAWADVELENSGLVVKEAATAPSLTLGRLGAFDDCGAMPGSIVTHRGRLLMYYTGWTLARAVPFTFFIGAAESRDGGKTFEKVSEAPVLGRNHHDPFLTGAPWVIEEDGRLRMWYISGTEWVPGATEGEAPTHYYSIKHAVSVDGISWQTDDRLCLPYLENEHAIARPVVMKADGGYRMIYSARRLGETYRIYSATSGDGLSWERDTSPLIEVAASGWDSEMVCYGSRLETPDGDFLLYNGNAYGKDGFGAARWR
ncbi:hypothetical protein H8A99_12775 [Bradyrhizobium sp. Arg68]|uniref:hypothetical protein n=1 Tax=Bradyrhizobium ivorense TaxID=2511166 RepID=UPI001E4AF6EF|nr:hypothetical protein [Bradyrhizobium ivorense]MCC8937324.1 hypothetical protein [Bradyrhizobium ivorense]